MGTRRSVIDFGQDDEFRIGFDAQLRYILAQLLGHRRDARTDHRIDYPPYHPRGGEHERPDGQDAGNLHQKIAGGGDADRERTPDSGKQMRGNRPDDVVDLEPVEELDANHHDGTADPADHHGPVVLDDVGPRGDRHQPADRTVQARQQVDAPQNRPRQRHRGNHARRRREVGVGEDIADGHGIGGAGERQLGAAVEPEPAHPENKHAERHHGHVGWWSGLHAAVLAVLAPSRADDQGAGERRPAAGRVDDRRPGKILEAHRVKPAAAPGPRADDRVDDRREHGDEQEERPEPHPLGQGAGDDGGGRGDEHHLEEPVRHRRLAGRDDCRAYLVGTFRAGQQLHFVGRGAIEQRERAEPAALLHPDIHDVVADEIEHQPGDGIEADILQADDRSVLGAHRARFEHGKAGAHPHYERAPYEERETVQDELRFVAYRRPGVRRKEHQRGGNPETDGGGGLQTPGRGATPPTAIAVPQVEPLVARRGRYPAQPGFISGPSCVVRHDVSCPLVRISASGTPSHPLSESHADKIRSIRDTILISC